MKRWAVFVSFLLFLALCASAAVWTMQLLKPAPRAVAAVPAPEAPIVVRLEAASALFGARTTSAPSSAGYALKGIVVARRPADSVAIVAVEGKPAQALRVGAEVVPGVTVKEVHSQFVLLSERGSEKRIDLPEKPGETITQGDRPQPANAPAETRATTVEPPAVSTGAAPPRERQQRARRRGDTKDSDRAD